MSRLYSKMSSSENAPLKRRIKKTMLDCNHTMTPIDLSNIEFVMSGNYRSFCNLPLEVQRNKNFLLCLLNAKADILTFIDLSVLDAELVHCAVSARGTCITNVPDRLMNLSLVMHSIRSSKGISILDIPRTYAHNPKVALLALTCAQSFVISGIICHLMRFGNPHFRPYQSFATDTEPIRDQDRAKFVETICSPIRIMCAFPNKKLNDGKFLDVCFCYHST